MKILKGIKLSENVAVDVTKRMRKGFNFSDWVEKSYVKEFLNEDVINNKINEYQQMIESLMIELKDFKNKQVSYDIGFSEEEKRYLLGVAIKLNNGYDIKALLKVFNNSFKRDLGMDDFKMAVKYFDNKESERK